MLPRSGAARGTLDGHRIEERRHARTRRRLMVRYGAKGNDRTGFTRNISETGLFLQTNHVFAPGSTIQVEIHFPERTLSFWARVAWAKKVPAQLSHLLECGMGLRFLAPDPAWPEFFAAWKKSAGLE